MHESDGVLTKVPPCLHPQTHTRKLYSHRCGSLRPLTVAQAFRRSGTQSTDNLPSEVHKLPRPPCHPFPSSECPFARPLIEPAHASNTHTLRGASPTLLRSIQPAPPASQDFSGIAARYLRSWFLPDLAGRPAAPPPSVHTFAGGGSQHSSPSSAAHLRVAAARCRCPVRSTTPPLPRPPARPACGPPPALRALRAPCDCTRARRRRQPHADWVWRKLDVLASTGKSVRKPRTHKRSRAHTCVRAYA